MLTPRTWLWLSACWLLYLTEAAVTSVCEFGPCKCFKGKLQCDCSTSYTKTLTLRPELFDSLSLSSVHVENCGSLHVTSRALSGLPALQQVTVTNVTTVTLEEQAFSYAGDSPQLLVNISHCHLPEIPSYCFHGQLRDVLLTDVLVSRIRAYAFSSMDHAEKLSFTRARVDLLESQAFKRFTVQLLCFIDTNVTLVSRRAFSDIEVLDEARFERFQSDRLETSAFNIHSSRSFKILQSTFKHVEERAFNLETKGDVSIHENTFSNVEQEAFLGITVNKRYFQEVGKEDFIFENNTLDVLESGSLTFNTSWFNPRIEWIKIQQQCSCDKLNFWINELVYFSSDHLVRTPAPQIGLITYCLKSKYTRLRDFESANCGVTKSSILLIILNVVLLILGIIGIIYLARYYRSRKKGKRYINAPIAGRALRPAEANKGHMLVVPEGKTYRETELQVIIEHAEPIVPTEFVQERPERNSNE